VTSERSLAPGVSYRALQDPAGPFASHVVQLDPGPAAALDTALAQDRLEGLETTTSMAARHGALAAVNGDFFLPTGRPLHAFADDGALLQAPRAGTLGVRATGVDGRALIGAPQPVMKVQSVASGRTLPLTRVNDGAPRLERAVPAHPRAGALEGAPSDACSARLRPLGKARRGLAGNTTSYVVEEAGCAITPMAPRGLSVLSTPFGSRHAGFVQGLLPGSTVRVSWTFGRPQATDLIGTHAIQLLDGGQVHPAVDVKEPFHARHPRTGLGVTAGGRTLLVVVDGRQPGYSVGMTLREFAEHLRGLGSVDAVLLDGGGSSTMVVQGRVVNRPADGAERPVANALLVHGGLSGWQAAPFVVTPEQARASLRAGRRVLTDQGSTGGLADAARGRGEVLSDELQHVGVPLPPPPAG
jgi:hypothetical protein